VTRLTGILIPLVIAAILIALCCTAVLSPIWPCPSCVDLELYLFRCDICGAATSRSSKRVTLLRRWRGIEILRAEGCKAIPLIPRIH